MIPHGCHIYVTTSDTDMAKVCSYPQSQHDFSNWKYVLRCCSNFPHIDIPYQESDRNQSNTSTSIHFHIYHLFVSCRLHRRRPGYEKKICRLCLQDLATVSPVNYTPENNFLLWIHLLLILTQVSLFHK